MRHELQRLSNIQGAARRAATGAIVSLLLLFFVAGTAHAQDFTVSGTVVDSINGESLPGVNVQVVGTTIGTATNAQGRFELQIPSENETLQFSFVGYQTKRVPVQGQSELRVQLTSQTLTGSEIVVVGYSTQQRQDLTGSVDVVDVADMTEIPATQVTEQLQGQASGVTVVSSGQPGEEPQINIRGFNTFGNNQPLYVVDGIPTQNISDLNAADIESLQVLKDAGAASIYGARAANGVIVITTKKGRGDLTVQFSSYAGIQSPPDQTNPWNILSPQGMADLRWMALRNSGVENPSSALYGSGETPVLPDFLQPAGASEGDPGTSPEDYFVVPFYTDPSLLNSFNRIVRANKAGTDYYDQIFDNAPMTKNDLSISGGGEMGNYLLSLGYLNQQGTLMRTNLERYTIRANTQFNITDNVRIGENISYTLSDNQQSGTLVEGSAIGMAFRQQPIIPVRDIMGNWAGSFGPDLGNAENPVAIRERTRNNDNENKRLFGNVFVEVDFLDDFRFRSNFGGDYNSGFFHFFVFPTYEASENATTNQYGEGSFNNRSWTFSNTLTYQNTFLDKHDVELLAGAEAVEERTQFVQGTVQDFFSFDPNFTSLNTGSGTRTNTSSATETALFSLIGRLDYAFANKYLVSFTVRRDGSSKFTRNRYGLFPAATAGWRISEESFMDDISWLTDLKLRGGYGVMGNQLNVDLNNPYTLFGGNQSNTFYDIRGTNSSIAQGFSRQRIGNPNAKWERNVNLNVGFDAAVFDGQLEATFDYYEKNIEDLLFNPELPGTSGGAAPPFVNVASMRNNGFDFSLRGQTTLFEELQVSIGGNVTSYNNEVVRLAEGFDSFSAQSRRFSGSNIIRNEVGQPVSSYYGYQIVGFWNDDEEIDVANIQAQEATGNDNAVFQTDAGLGRFRYADIDGDGQITPDDRTFLGSPNPDFTYGLNMSMAYRNWDFNLSLYGVQGNEIWNQVKWWTDFFPSFNGAKSETALNDSWTRDNPDATAPIQENRGSFSTNQVPNSYYVEDGSYLRVRNIQLGYTLPTRLVDPVGMQRLRLYVQAANVLTITGYSGIDPEIGAGSDGNSTAFGIDEGAFAAPRKLLVGVNLTF
jgi:TonB-linked SusC/RagA family outer membrane protein